MGLPVHLGQLGLSPDDEESVGAVVGGALAFPYLVNMPFSVDSGALRQAILDADALGRGVAD